MRTLILFFAWLSLSSSAFSQNLVAYYPFNGNANDESGNGNNGIVNGATLTADRFGNAGKAYHFTNPNYIEVLNSNLFGDEFTVSYWFKIGYYFGQRGVMSNVAIPNGGFQQVFDGTAFSYILGYSFVGGYSPNYFYANYTMQEPVGQWHHVAVTYKKLGTYSSESKLYINGVLKRTDAHSMPITFTPNATFYIGQNHGGLNFEGDLDDIKIYNRILSPNEIAQLADIALMPNLLVYLPLNGNQDDISGYNRNGTPYGGALWTTDKYNNPGSAYLITNPDCGISLDNTSNLDFIGQPFSLSSWVKYSNIPAADFAVLAKNNCGAPNGYILAVNNNIPRFYLCSGGSWSMISDTQTYNDNKWHHLVATYDGSGVQKLYVDGILKASATSVVYNTPASGAPIIIGDANGNCGGPTFTGSIDEVKIYGAALDADQITALYKQSRGSGMALQFIGNSTNQLQLSEPINPPPAISGFTMEAWVLRRGVTGKQMIFAGADSSSMLWGFDGDQMIFGSLIGDQVLSTGPSLNDNKWHHIAVATHSTLPSGAAVVFYIDGMPAGGPFNISALPMPNGVYAIGNRPGTTQSFNGSLDEIRIWADVLPLSTLRNWMNRKITHAHPNFESLGFYFNFDEATLTKAYELKQGIYGNLIDGGSYQWSGAALGDTSVADFTNTTKTATILFATDDGFTATATYGNPDGISVYMVKDPPANVSGALGTGSIDHYFGVHLIGGSSPSYSAIYQYGGSPLVTTAVEPGLALFRRNDNSAQQWTNATAALNTTLKTLTVTGQNTEYILGSTGFGLPVTWLSFEARKLNVTTVQLNWKTAQEINNKGFEVQRSFDGNYFTAIQFINGAGNANAIKEYRCTDVPGRTGRIFYRLKQVDLNGNSKLSNIVSVLLDQQAEIKVYPNPAQRQIIIEGANSYKRIQLIDASGRIVREQLNNNQYLLQMNVEGLNNGTYFLLLQANNESRTMKLIIQQ